ncbi:TRAP transporter fused permease subunit [Pseudosulfitobacter sp. DSM 107133]|uniref:TRAP transporter permease n=1 Tax=Pseudosulfitobacter sp. DSM 107133 TaxID=2883100 RepID=UPI001F079C14|nr:TRAP transporter fused permease subunit [Pseudosulfitobacter sp. DSM 107133]UOA29189.1 C4-dicarboxylate TRAP transporter large permease protein DctM [Pseudosulfitobacter sp. DSM 107133]
MTTPSDIRPPQAIRFHTMARILGLVLVVIGLFNTTPSIPGLDAWVAQAVGNPGFVIRKFPYEYLYPLAFVLMMVIVALNHSFWVDALGKTRGRRIFGACMDVALVTMAIALSLSYLIEIDSICLIDQFTGERAELIARALIEEKEFAELYGLPAPTSVDDPSCINTLGVWLFAVVGAGIAVFLGYNVKVWGFPLVAVAIVVAAYTLITVLVWYYFGADDTNKYLITKLGGEPRTLMDGRPNIEDVLVNTSQGLMGRFMGILLSTVFPYIVLGSLFGISAGGQSLIKLAFLWTRRLRGGPAHAAIVSSALFGTISGGPVVNVLSTGVLTIPMMLKRGFSKTFAGGIEAAASSGGQIMPPVMGVAAFVLAAMTAVPYREVIIAAIIPSVAYFGCLFLTVVFQARKQKIEAVGDKTPDMMLNRQDLLNLVMIFGPILLILFLLVTPKEAIGCGPVAALFNIQTIATDTTCRAVDLPFLFQLVQNSAGDAGSAGWWAVFLLAILFLLDPAFRRKPAQLVGALADAGILISTLYLMFLSVSVIDFCLNFTGLSGFIARDVLSALRLFGTELQTGGIFLFAALFVTMLMSILLGMGMPTVPAYVNVALLMGPLVIGLGIAPFTAHMFIFFFAVASAITPPVAVAAFAAASITKADPMRTGFSAVRAGVVMFVLPFVFVFYPELLLIDAAKVDPNALAGTEAFLAGYSSGIDWPALALVVVRVMLGLYLLASALSRYDRHPLGRAEIGLRLALGLGVVMHSPMIWGPAVALTAAYLAWYTISATRRVATP